MSLLAAEGVSLLLWMAGAILTGRLLVAAVRARTLRAFTPAAACASMILGVALETAVFGGLTFAGGSARRIAIAEAGVVAALLLALRGRADVLRPRGTVGRFLLVFGPLVALAAVALAPARGGDFWIGNDAFTYCGGAEWLQDHALHAAKASSPALPYMAYFAHTFGGRLRLGVTYLLALAEAATRSPSAVVVYPVVSALGLVLVAASLVVALRWIVRMPYAGIGACLAGFVLLPHIATWAHRHGFLSQPFGLAGGLLLIALATRALRGRRPDMGGGVLLGLAAAFLLCVYLPLLPFVALSLVLGLVPLAARRPGRSRARGMLMVAAAAAAGGLVFGGPDLRILFDGVHRLGTVLVGSHLSVSLPAWLSMASGVQLYRDATPIPGALLLPAAAAALLALVGLWYLARRPGTALFLGNVIVFSGALAYFALVARDPWTNERGHTWNVFKIVQWAYPTLFLLQCAGVLALRRYRAALAIAAAIPLFAATIQARTVTPLGEGAVSHLASVRDPLADLPRLCSALRAQPGGVFVVGRPADRDPWLGPYLSLLAFPREIDTDWNGSAWHKGFSFSPSNVAPLPVVCTPTQPPTTVVADLGWGCGALDTTKPFVAGLRGRNLLSSGTGRLEVDVFAPGRTWGDLVLELRDSPSKVAVSVDGVNAGVARLDAALSRIRLHVRAGMTRVRVGPAPDATLPHIDEVRFEAEPDPTR